MEFPTLVIPFAGQHEVDFDKKHRLTLPSNLHKLLVRRNQRINFRDILYARLDQVRGAEQDKCFYVLINDVAAYVHRPKEEDCSLWTPISIRSGRRILLPDYMTKEAKLEEKIILCATRDGKGIEAWNPLQYRIYRPVAQA